MSRNKVDPYLFPARGRKRYSVSNTSACHHKGLIPTFSPQGDGNGGSSDGYCDSSRIALIPTFSPQGDGNRSKQQRH